MPAKFTSKLKNIHVVCLCNSDDLKSKQTYFDNIWQLIVNEISILESKGITVNGTSVKGTLVHTAFDNLGANVGLGFSGSFLSKKYCHQKLNVNSSLQRDVINIMLYYAYWVYKFNWTNKIKLVLNCTRKRKHVFYLAISVIHFYFSISNNRLW